jgi:hypothetical protein
MNLRLGFAISFVCLLSFDLLSQDPNHVAVESTKRTIRQEQIRAHMRFLSDSLLQGRAPETAGYDVAASEAKIQSHAVGDPPAGGHSPDGCPKHSPKMAKRNQR